MSTQVPPKRKNLDADSAPMTKRSRIDEETVESPAEILQSLDINVGSLLEHLGERPQGIRNLLLQRAETIYEYPGGY